MEIQIDLSSSSVARALRDIYMLVAVDFDGTIVTHRYPNLGEPVPGALDKLRSFMSKGYKIILWTMRSDGGPDGDMLSQAVNYLRDNGIELYGINQNPTQAGWTESPKAYAQVYIDDAAYGCPLIYPAGTALEPKPRPYVDWDKVVL